MKKAAEDITRILEMRFGKMEAQALAFGRARVMRLDVQFTDVLQLANLCERYRGQLRASISAYKVWRVQHDVEADTIVRLYAAAEGALLHRRVADSLKLWYFAHRDYHAMRQVFLLKCMAPNVRVHWDQAA